MWCNDKLNKLITNQIITNFSYNFANYNFLRILRSHVTAINWLFINTSQRNFQTLTVKFSWKGKLDKLSKRISDTKKAENNFYFSSTFLSAICRWIFMKDRNYHEEKYIFENNVLPSSLHSHNWCRCPR